MERFHELLRLSCFFLLLFNGCKKAEVSHSERPVRALRLEEEQLVSLHSFPGRTRAVDRVNLSFRVDGPLIEKPARVGLIVKKGDLLARIDPRDFEVKLENAEGRLEKVEAQARFAERDFKRAKKIWEQDPGAISQSLLDQKEEEWNELKGQVKSLEAQVASAQDQIQYTSLYAPFEGIIVATYVDNFEYVRAKQAISRLLNLSQIEMVIHVPENLITDIPYVDCVTIQFDTFPGREFPARIKEIGTEASATTRTYPVTLVMNQPRDVMILSGMAGYAYLSSEKRGHFSERGFLLPTTAIFTDNQELNTYVWVVDPETEQVEQREVKKGKLTQKGILITEGLEPGEWVVTSGVTFLYEGQKVKVLPIELSEQGEQVELRPPSLQDEES